jgi:hypothetical protein
MDRHEGVIPVKTVLLEDAHVDYNIYLTTIRETSELLRAQLTNFFIDYCLEAWRRKYMTTKSQRPLPLVILPSCFYDLLEVGPDDLNYNYDDHEDGGHLDADIITIQLDSSHWYFLSIEGGTMHVLDGQGRRLPKTVVAKWKRWWKSEHERFGRSYESLRIEYHNNYGTGPACDIRDDFDSFSCGLTALMQAFYSCVRHRRALVGDFTYVDFQQIRLFVAHCLMVDSFCAVKRIKTATLNPSEVIKNEFENLKSLMT